MLKSDEMVLVVRRSLFESLGSFHGIQFCVGPYLPELLSCKNNFFMSRRDAESNPDYKQLIPYAIFTWQDKILHYTRGSTSGEQRLVAKGSIGIGGHINDSDAGLSHFDENAYRTAVHREVREELCLEGGFEDRIAGLINDDSTEVGQVHLGIIHLVELESPQVRSGESAIKHVEFLSIEELQNRITTLESWSQLIVTHWEELRENLYSNVIV